MAINEQLHPTTLFVRTTENCNAGCFMCDYANNSGEPFLSSDDVVRIVEQAQQAGIQLIRFTGGEPLLDRDISSYIEYIHQQGIKTSLITNGYLLPQRAEALVAAGLDQVIVSLDASNATLHNQLRNLPTLFERATAGIKTIQDSGSNTIVRINSVISPHNISDMEAMADTFESLRADQWSIIPLKGANIWSERHLSEYLRAYNDFLRRADTLERPKLLGYSAVWAGRDESEASNYFLTGRPFTPRDKCDLVSVVRFYDPIHQRLAACNCVPWRLREVGIQGPSGIEGLNDGSATPLVEFLHEHGPSTCTGCEPINAYLAEHPQILEEDIFLF